MQMTVGWIFEGDRDRFLAARYPTPAAVRTAEVFRCPFCQDNFTRRSELSAHVQKCHSIKRPFLLIAGVEPGAEETIRTCLHPSALEVFNCTGLFVGFDGEALRPIRLPTLAQQLTGLRRADIRLQLSKVGVKPIQPVIQEYHLKIVAPDEESLARVDKLFFSTLDVDDINLDKVGAFCETTRDEPAAEYAEALADYVRAALIKDGDPRTGVSGRLSHYHEVQNRALNSLQSFDRPLANVLASLIRFALNDFSRWREPSGFAPLDHAYRVIGPLAQDHRAPHRSGTSVCVKGKTRVFICPVDVGTDAVTRVAKEAADLTIWNAAVEERFRAQADQASLDSFDRAKIHALWALTALQLRARASAERPLRLLDGHPTFGKWANRKLAEVAS